MEEYEAHFKLFIKKNSSSIYGVHKKETPETFTNILLLFGPNDINRFCHNAHILALNGEI